MSKSVVSPALTTLDTPEDVKRHYLGPCAEAATRIIEEHGVFQFFGDRFFLDAAMVGCDLSDNEEKAAALVKRLMANPATADIGFELDEALNASRSLYLKVGYVQGVAVGRRLAPERG